MDYVRTVSDLLASFGIRKARADLLAVALVDEEVLTKQALFFFSIEDFKRYGFKHGEIVLILGHKSGKIYLIACCCHLSSCCSIESFTPFFCHA